MNARPALTAAEVTAAFPRPSMPIFGERLRITRVVSGLVLITYVFLHLTNHALGIFSVDVMEAVQPYTVKLFRTWPGTILLAGAALTHFCLALWALYLKRRFSMPAWEATQMLLGFTIPFLLVQHVVAVRIMYERFATDVGYSYIIWSMGQEPWVYLTQSALLIIAWTHGSMGIHYWLRLQPWYPKVSLGLGIVAITLPLVALIGFLQAVREVDRLDADPIWHRAFQANAAVPGDAGSEWLWRLELSLFATLGAIGLGLMLARAARRIAERRRGIVQVTFPGSNIVSTPPGPTVLEIARSAGLEHASVCGGRCRCSTCRVRVGRGGESLPPPAADEARVLARIGASAGVRLACQIRPIEDVEITPLFPVPPDMHAVRNVVDYHHGREMEIVVMFADLRGFTTASEHRLPYDTVFLLNRYFAEMSKAISSSGGLIDKFMGDGIMALFGLEEDLVRGATNALRAARAMSQRLEVLNYELHHDLSKPLKIGIGLHCGTAIVGEVGWGPARKLTAIGDMVNTTARIEGLTKRFDCELLVSSQLANIVGASLEGFEKMEVDVRGRQGKIEVTSIPRARDLTIIDAMVDDTTWRR